MHISRLTKARCETQWNENKEKETKRVIIRSEFETELLLLDLGNRSDKDETNRRNERLRNERLIVEADKTRRDNRRTDSIPARARTVLSRFLSRPGSDTRGARSSVPFFREILCVDARDRLLSPGSCARRTLSSRDEEEMKGKKEARADKHARRDASQERNCLDGSMKSFRRKWTAVISFWEKKKEAAPFFRRGIARDAHLSLGWRLH